MMMKNSSVISSAVRLTIAAAACLPLAGCIDDNYDLGNDIDLTMGLGAEGLQLKLGNTEKIMLADLLETDDNLHTDASSRYYLVEHGSTAVDFSVSPVSAYIDNADLQPTAPLADYESVTGSLGGASVPAGTAFSYTGVNATADLDMEVSGIGTDVAWIKAVEPAAGMKVRFYLELRQQGAAFALRRVRNLKIQFPDCLNLTAPVGGTLSGNVFTVADLQAGDVTAIDLGEATLAGVMLPGETGKVTGASIRLADQALTMSGDFAIGAPTAFTMGPGGTVSLRLTVYIGDRHETHSQVDIASVTGRFTPTINPSVSDIGIAGHLPDFLQDDEVAVRVDNPTLKFVADMTQVPAALSFSADLASVKGGQTIAAVRLPAADVADIGRETVSTVYFYQDAQAGPFDPDGVTAGAQRHQADGISSLIDRLPDHIAVGLDGGRVRLKDEDATLRLGHVYSTRLDHELLVPFSFSSGLRVVYNDSVDGMNKDLKDYEAEGITITADVLNAIPLDLDVTADAVDTEGRAISGITVGTARVSAAAAAGSYANAAAIDAAAKTTAITLDMDLSDPALLHRLDRLRFRVAASSTENQKAILSSLQYLAVKNLRLKLKGNIIANFN